MNVFSQKYHKAHNFIQITIQLKKKHFAKKRWLASLSKVYSRVE